MGLHRSTLPGAREPVRRNKDTSSAGGGGAAGGTFPEIREEPTSPTSKGTSGRFHLSIEEGMKTAFDALCRLHLSRSPTASARAAQAGDWSCLDCAKRCWRLRHLELRPLVTSTARSDPAAGGVTPSKALPAVELHRVDLEDLFLQCPAGTGTPTATPITTGHTRP